MPRLSQAEIRNNAIAFVHEWKDETRERAESQTFWNEFLEIFGIKRRRVAVFEKAVPKHNQNMGSIDLFWRGVLVVEHKSRGKSLDKASSQAFEYLENLSEDELPELVLISDFERFRLYNLETNEEIDFALAKLPEMIQLFGAISGYQKREYKEQDPVNLKVARKLGELHDELASTGYSGQQLEAFLVRLVYCLFADDTGVFLPRSSFLYFLEEKTAEDGSNLGAMLAQLFQVLDTTESARQTTLDEDLKAFPYVNGALFRDRFDMPSFNRHMRKILIEACSFDWAKVSPAIFGSLFQSVMDPEKRRNLGAHYTSEKNILKVIHGLFLDELNSEFESVKNSVAKLQAFHDKLATLRFFDPACGSGNFLVITYREIRRLELKVILQLRQLRGDEQAQLLVTKLSRIDVDSFYGIEIEEFAAEVARVALWLTDHLANMELSAALGIPYTRLPLEHTPNIVYGNALRMDWSEVLGRNPSGSEGVPTFATTSERGTLPTGRVSAFDPNGLFILGNPPFVGKKEQDASQKDDMEAVFSGVKGSGVLDYVTAWYIKAAEMIQNTRIRVAFVSTNSISQGEQVGTLWSVLFRKYNVKIHFAHRSFKWTNEAKGNAAVHVVIIGFANFDTDKKRLFEYQEVTAEPNEISVTNINPYLVSASDSIVISRSTPICSVPEMIKGSEATDDGHLILSVEEANEIVKQNPLSAKFIRPFIGGNDLINNHRRFCLWLKDADPTELKQNPLIVERVAGVRDFRLASTKQRTRDWANYPTLFSEDRQPTERYLMIPKVSSEKRHYIPFAFVQPNVIVNNTASFVPNASMYLFGVLTSKMHMVWMKYVCGRMKSDYQYTNKIVYNNFPWPEMSEPPAVAGGLTQSTDMSVIVDARHQPPATAGGSDKRSRVEKTAQGILDARALFPNATLADLYDPLTMPKELLDAHRANDEAVDAAYGKRKFANELERLEFLFDLYRQYTEPLNLSEKGKTSKRSRK